MSTTAVGSTRFVLTMSSVVRCPSPVSRCQALQWQLPVCLRPRRSHRLMVLQRHSRQLRNPQLKDQQTICLSKKVPVGWPNKHNKSNKSLCGVRIPRRFSFLCPLIVAGLFHLIHQFLALAEVKDVLEGGEGDVVYGLTGEECLVGGHDDVGHHQQQGQLVVVNHLV